MGKLKINTYETSISNESDQFIDITTLSEGNGYIETESFSISTNEEIDFITKELKRRLKETKIQNKK